MSNKPGGTSRRRLLQSLGIVGTGMTLQSSGVAVAEGHSLTETIRLGDFESGRDSWKTNGGNNLHIVEKDTFPLGITRGKQALGFRIDGDSYPILWTEDLEYAAFDSNPALAADVVATTYDNDAPIVFQFRYHYTGTKDSSNPDSRKSGGEDKRKSGRPNIATSDKIRVQQRSQASLYWDMSELPDEALRTPTRLDLVWYPANQPPDSQSDGRGSHAEYDYQGVVIFDNIRLLDTPGVVGVLGVRQTIDELEAAHGPVESTFTGEINNDTEIGEFKFVDGATVSYELTILDDGKTSLTIDGSSFTLGDTR